MSSRGYLPLEGRDSPSPLTANAFKADSPSSILIPHRHRRDWGRDKEGVIRIQMLLSTLTIPSWNPEDVLPKRGL